LSATEFGKLGYAAVLFPVTMLRVAAKAVEQALAQLAREGSQKNFVDRMQTRAELYDLLDYTGFESRDQSYFGR
jgi:methylisocitrate lyase